MIHLDTIHRSLVICVFLFGIAVFCITCFTYTFIDRQQIRSLPGNEQAKAIPRWAGLIAPLGMARIVFAIDVLLFRRGLFR